MCWWKLRIIQIIFSYDAYLTLLPTHFLCMLLIQPDFKSKLVQLVEVSIGDLPNRRLKHFLRLVPTGGVCEANLTQQCVWWLTADKVEPLPLADRRGPLWAPSAPPPHCCSADSRRPYVIAQCCSGRLLNELSNDEQLRDSSSSWWNVSQLLAAGLRWKPSNGGEDGGSVATHTLIVEPLTSRSTTCFGSSCSSFFIC